jgi:uncharacterized protein (DUF58 family)
VRGLATAVGGLTTRGRWFLSAGLLLTGFSLELGERDLLRVGLLLAILPLAAAALVARTRYRLLCARTLEPGRIAAGGTSTVTLRLENVGRLLSCVLMVTDEVPTALGAGPRFVLDRIASGAGRALAYPLTGQGRGRYPVGPLTVRLSDPFGLCELSRSFRGRDDLVVTPAVEDLPWLRRAGTAMSAAGVIRSAAMAGDDDAAPRAYRHGDDLRRVHWRSTARTGDLMVRREETPRSSRATVLLDTRRASWAGSGPSPSFEWAVRAAASVATALGRSGHHVRLIFDAGQETTAPPGGTALLLDELAEVTTSDAVSLARAVAPARRGAPAGTTVAVVGAMTARDAAELSRARPVTGIGVAVIVDVASWDDGGNATPTAEAAAVRGTLHRAGWTVIEAGHGDTLAGVWPTRAHGRGAPGRVARGRAAAGPTAGERR